MDRSADRQATPEAFELPRALREVTPRYTVEAMLAKIEGEVRLEVVVLPDGSVGDVTVVQSLDSVLGLDEEAVKAARGWHFVSGTRFGEPVAMSVTIELSFTLGDGRVHRYRNQRIAFTTVWWSTPK